jgi:hypothetical protein
MLYPWPITGSDVPQEALDIAMDYLEFTGQAVPLTETQCICANAILAAWNVGTRHRIKLADCAIVAVEKGTPLTLPCRRFSRDFVSTQPGAVQIAKCTPTAELAV